MSIGVVTTGEPDTPVGRAIERLREAFLSPPQKVVKQSEEFSLADFTGDSDGRKIEDYAYRVLGRLYARIGRHGFAMGMPQLKVYELPPSQGKDWGTLRIEWHVSSLSTDLHFHHEVSESVKFVVRQLAAEDVKIPSGRSAAIQLALERIVNHAVLLGEQLELKEKAADQMTGDPLEGSQGGAGYTRVPDLGDRV